MKIPYFRLSTFDFESLTGHQSCVLDARLGRMTLSHRSRGFTLIELLVSIGIFTLMTGVVLSNYRNYSTNALFANASEDIVLALRQAQVYGVGARGQTGSFTTPYGVYFTDGNQIKIFADNGTSAQIFDAGDTTIETITFKSPISIVTLKCGGVNCPALSVTFKRPNPDAVIYGNGVINDVGEVALSNGVVGPGAKSSKITISKAGQISLQ